MASSKVSANRITINNKKIDKKNEDDQAENKPTTKNPYFFDTVDFFIVLN